jgi:cysteine desulfurase
MSADQILFTSGGTEANNLAIFGLLEGRQGDLVVSSIEHPSLLGAAAQIATRSERRVRYLPVTPDGQVCLATWNQWLGEHITAEVRGASEGRIAMISVMLANNETGAIQPIAQIAEDATAHGILVHSDAIQAVGKIPLNFSSMKFDAMSVTAHKIHGPVGVGALVLRHGVALQPILWGGFQQMGLRPGTECVALAAGFSKAVSIALEDLAEHHTRMTGLREMLEARLLAGPRRPTVVACTSPRLPHTLSLAYPGIERQALQMALDRSGVQCSTGSACASGSGQPSHVLQAMRLPEPIVRGAIRLSLSVETTQEEIDEAAQRILEVVDRFPTAEG